MSDHSPGRTDRPRLEVHSKVWVERGGAVVMSEFRAGLLQAIEEHGSVARAAEAVGLPYRTAWKKLREMEEAARLPLLESGSGGPGGGRSRLTAGARSMLSAFLRVSNPASLGVRERFDEEKGHFGR